MKSNIEELSLILASHLEILVKACDSACASFPSLISLTKMERAALNILGEHDGMTVGSLSDHLKAPMSSTSVLIDALTASGIAARTRGTQDRRSVVVHLTEEGKMAYSDLQQSRFDFARELLLPMVPEERGQFLALIEIAKEALEKKAGAVSEASLI